MQFTAKTYSLNEKFHTGLHVGVNGRTDGHVLTEISRYHFSLPMVLRYKYPMASTRNDVVKRETSSALRFDCFWDRLGDQEILLVTTFDGKNILQ